MASSESDELSTTLDHLIVRHPDGTVSKTPIPNQAGATIAVGRELDNEVVLDDPRVSRRHAQIRRAAAGGLEITDVGSANGTFVGGLRVRLNQWSPLAAGQTVSIGGTRLVWEEAVSSQATVGMMPVAAPKGAAPAPPARRSAGLLPWLVGGGLLAAALVIVVLFINAVRSPAPPATTAATAAAGPVDIARQTPQGPAAGAPQPTATPASPAGSLPAPAIPSLTLEAVEFLPVISGALFDTSHVYLIASVRVENLGDEPFIVSTGRFAAQTQTGETITELGQGFAPSEFKRLGVTDRFDDLLLRSGGGVSEELIFYLAAKPYDVSLVFQPDNLEPLSLNLGRVEAGQELAQLLGTPTPEPPAAAAAATATPPPPPTTTPRPTPAGGAARTIASQTLAGTIAFADFNGATYDLYFGNVATGQTVLWRAESSQPAFNSDGRRIAYHSWANDSRGLFTANLDHSNAVLVGTFLEDQLPTWSPDDSQILFLSRRTGTRQSQLYLAPFNQNRPDGEFVLEGEYPTWHPSGVAVFKGWVTSGEGLRVAAGGNLTDYAPLTDNNSDTAPSISPDGKRVAFMSSRNNNWDIYVVNVDGSGLTRLTSDEAQDGLPAWSPDGNAIAFVSNRGGPWAVWAMTPTGSGIRQLFTYRGTPDGFVASEPTIDTTRGWAEERISWSPRAD